MCPQHRPSPFQELKLFDFVFCKSQYDKNLEPSSTHEIMRIARVTDKQIVLSNGSRFWRDNGIEVGDRDRLIIQFISDETVKKLQQQEHRDFLVQSLKESKWEELPTELLLELLNKMRNFQH